MYILKVLVFFPLIKPCCVVFLREFRQAGSVLSGARDWRFCCVLELEALK
jgi:hypothetical protein